METVQNVHEKMIDILNIHEKMTIILMPFANKYGYDLTYDVVHQHLNALNKVRKYEAANE